MTDYIDIGGFKTRFGITTSDKDLRILEHISGASRKVDAMCGRTFAGDTVATARYFRPVSCDTVTIDDAYQITEVAVDDDDDATYGTVWAATSDYATEPNNGVGPNGQTGWPASSLRAVGSEQFPTRHRRRAVRVTAKWGWPAVPDDVVEACYLLANRLFYEVSVPGGVTPPQVDFGLPGAALQRPHTAEGLLEPYRRFENVIGIA